MFDFPDRRAWPHPSNHIPFKKKSVPKKKKKLDDIPLFFDPRHSKPHVSNMTPSPSPAADEHGGNRLPQQYCLKWNNHNSNISGVFDRLRFGIIYYNKSKKLCYEFISFTYFPSHTYKTTTDVFGACNVQSNWSWYDIHTPP